MSQGPPFDLPPAWVNQNIVLYHGTVNKHVAAISRGISFSSGSRTVDFGLGFYTTTNEKQAKYWAWRRWRGRTRRRAGIQPAIVRFKVSREALAHLDSLSFIRGDYDATDFWSLVFHCRRGNNHEYSQNGGWYDVVAGPVASPYQRSVMLGYDQISFHTSRATSILDKSHREYTVFDATTDRTLIPWSLL